LLLANYLTRNLLFGESMQRKQILRFLVPVSSIVALSILSATIGQKLGEDVTKNGIHDYPLITIAFYGFFLFGFFTYWIMVKLGIE
jgi:hypothetical protein